MDPVEKPATPQPVPRRTWPLWFLLASSVVAIIAALVPCADVLGRQGPNWLAAGAALAVFPFLPILWHGLAEIRRAARESAPFTGQTRFALRSLAVAAVVVGVSLSDLGAARVFENVKDLAGRLHKQSMVKPEVPPTPAPVASRSVAGHGLESFIPADATLVVGLAGSTAMEQLLAAHGIDTREKLAALKTCKIDFVNARVLIAARRDGIHMIVLRASGITDERNLYCLVGVMGPNRLQVRTDGSGATKTLQVTGFLARPLTFQLLDATTLVSIDEGWQGTVDRKLFSSGVAAPQESLALPLARVDRTASVWVASVDETPQGTWDLALNSRQEGSTFRLQGSSTPPSGAGDRAEISVRVPLAFASALPESAVALGIRGVVAAVVATGASLSLPTVAPTLSRPTPDGGGAR
jgi:hypothetical protein